MKTERELSTKKKSPRKGTAEPKINPNEAANKRLTKCNVRRAAEIFGKSQAAVYQMVWRREIPFRRAGKRSLYFFEEELFQWLDSQPGLRLDELKKR